MINWGSDAYWYMMSVTSTICESCIDIQISSTRYDALGQRAIISAIALCMSPRIKDFPVYVKPKSVRGQEKISFPRLWVGDQQLSTITNSPDLVNGVSTLSS